jgi:hypothetical protein
MLHKCTDIALTMDGRKSRLIVRMRLTMGNGMPERLHPEAEDASVGGTSPVGSVAVANVFGRCIHRLVSCRCSAPFDTTEVLAGHLKNSLHELCGGDGSLWEEVKAKVKACTPYGAPDEQLVGKLVAEEFPRMMAVLRCAAHAVVGAMKAGWEASPLAQHITRCIVQEVAEYIRSSGRFASRVGSKALEGAIAAVEISVSRHSDSLTKRGRSHGSLCMHRQSYNASRWRYASPQTFKEKLGLQRF